MTLKISKPVKATLDKFLVEEKFPNLTRRPTVQSWTQL